MSWLVSLTLAGMMAASQLGFSADSSDNANVSQISAPAPPIAAQDETERFEQTYPLNANGRISVSNVNGSITIEAWDRREVRLEAVKTADSRETLNSVKIEIDAKPDFLKIETDHDSWKTGMGGTWRNRRLEVRYRLQVPRDAVLDEIATVNGSVAVSNVTNRTKISTVNGEIQAVNLRGAAQLETVNGTINADFESLQNVGEISLEAVNGTTNLVIPSDADATIKAETVNGSISNDFGLPVRKGKYIGRDMHGRIGSGAVKINLQTVNGASSVLRRADGKTVKPTTNLLPAKTVDDDVDDAMLANPPGINTAKINREVARAIKNSAKEVQKAQKEIVLSQKDRAVLESLDVGKTISEAIGNSITVPMDAVTEAVAAQVGERVRREMEGYRRNARLSGANPPLVESKTETFAVRGAPRVTVDAKNCRVFVRGWDKPEVRYAVLKLGRGAVQLPLAATAKQTGAEINIEIPETETDASEDVRVEVFVPKKSNLKILTNREIRVEGISGEIDLKGANETVNVRDAGGKLTVETDDAAIRVIGFTGEIDAQTIDGMMSLEGDFRRLAADASTGTIILTLPANANATLAADSPITAQGFDLIKEQEAGEKSRWRLGRGGANYDLRAVDGQIIIRNAAELMTIY